MVCLCDDDEGRDTSIWEALAEARVQLFCPPRTGPFWCPLTLTTYHRFGVPWNGSERIGNSSKSHIEERRCYAKTAGLFERIRRFLQVHINCSRGAKNRWSCCHTT